MNVPWARRKREISSGTATGDEASSPGECRGIVDSAEKSLFAIFLLSFSMILVLFDLLGSGAGPTRPRDRTLGASH